MDQRNPKQKFTPSKDAILGAFLLVLTVLSLHGALDRFAYDRLADTTTESIGIYALSRTINAGISSVTELPKSG